MFSAFNGGKALASKVKFSRFYIIIDIQGDEEDIDATELYFKMSTAVKKGVQAHKLGENGFKPNASGAYFNAHDNHNETFKLLEDAIAQVNCNTPERKHLSIGINVDSESYFLADQGKYDIDGPKNLYDSNMLADWIIKLSTDHPLLTYIEDPFVNGEISGYQKLQEGLKERDVKVSVQKWFGSDIDQIKENTAFIQPESEDEELDEESKDKEEEVEAEDLIEASKETSQALGNKKSSTSKQLDSKAGASATPAPEDSRAIIDPNAEKFIPGCIHFDRTQFQTIQPFVDILNYNSFLKTEEQMGVVYGDYTFESNQTMMMDWAFACQVSHVNLKGFGKVERSTKVDRF